MYKGIKAKIKNILPSTIWNTLKTIKHPIKSVMFRLTLAKTQKNYKVALEKVREKVKKGEKIKVAFFVLYESVWKYDGVYKLMEESTLFEPSIFICPVVNKGEEHMVENITNAFVYFSSRGYNVVNTYNQMNNSFLDVKKEYDPDIIFYTNPYENIIHSKYYIDKYLETLTCYVPYAIMTADFKMFYDTDFHNFVWKIFEATKIHKQISCKTQRIKSKNIIVTGHPSLDKFIAKRKFDDVWKIKDKKIKRIIWAPHHLLSALDKRSNFLEYYDFFQELAIKYKNKVQFVFKPHPLLKDRLYNNKEWGREKADAYYNFWAQLENGQLEESAYDDLFMGSDALIHDCGSFMTEYIATGKPCLFMLKDTVISHLSDYGKEVLSLHYISREKSNILDFIDNVVLENNDKKFNERVFFIDNVLVSSNKTTASFSIYEYLLQSFKI